jgi:hypothetical protein
MLIPSEMMHVNYKLDPSVVRASNVPTPRWRELNIDGLPANYAEIEDLDDATFAKRHELAELRERYHMVFKRLERQRNLSGSQHNLTTTAVSSSSSLLLNKRQELTTREAFEREHQIEKLSLMEFKRLVLRLESEHNQQLRRRYNSGSCATTSASILSSSMPASVLKDALLKDKTSVSATTTTASSILPPPSSRSLAARNIVNNKKVPVATVTAPPQLARRSSNLANRDSLINSKFRLVELFFHPTLGYYKI